MKRLYGATACCVVGCDRPHYAKGFCATHYKQSQRAAVKVAKPIRKASAPGDLVTLGVRVRASTAEALGKVGATATSAAREVLEAWAKRRAAR